MSAADAAIQMEILSTSPNATLINPFTIHDELCCKVANSTVRCVRTAKQPDGTADAWGWLQSIFWRRFQSHECHAPGRRQEASTERPPRRADDANDPDTRIRYPHVPYPPHHHDNACARNSSRAHPLGPPQSASSGRWPRWDQPKSLEVRCPRKHRLWGAPCTSCT